MPEPIEFWTPENPCGECGAVSNTGHSSGCSNFGLYDEEGNAIPATPEIPIEVEVTTPDDVLVKVYETLVSSGIDDQQAADAVFAMQVAGILFQEVASEAA